MYIGIDCGSSFLKFARLCEGGPEKETRIATVRLPDADARRAEYALEPVVSAVRDYIDEAIDSGARVDGILFSTQMHGCVLRGADGAPSPYISWQDELVMEETAEGIPFETLRRLAAPYLAASGMCLKPEMALCSLYARARRGERSLAGGELYTLGSCLIAALCGRNVTHETNAAPTGLYDLRAHRWNEPLLEAIGFDGLRLPQVETGVRPCGTYRGVPIYPDVGDQQAALLGAGLLPGQISVNLGTASQVSVLAPSWDGGRDGLCGEIRPFFGGTYLHTVSKLSGGRSMQVIVEFLRRTVELFTGTAPEVSAMWERIGMIEPADGAGVRAATGFYETQMFPGASVAGLDACNFTPENLLRAAFADLAAQFGRVIGQLDPDGRASQILLTGGRMSAQIAPYLRLDAVCGRYPIVSSDTGDAVFRGLCRLTQLKEEDV